MFRVSGGDGEAPGRGARAGRIARGGSDRRPQHYPNLDHGDLHVFPPDAPWPQIVADPLPFVRASEELSDGPAPVEYLEPWRRHSWVEVEYPG